MNIFAEYPIAIARVTAICRCRRNCFISFSFIDSASSEKLPPYLFYYKSSDRIENIVSDICGLQYNPNPTIHLNQYMMLWSRKKILTGGAEDNGEVRLISPMGTIVRDKVWLKTFFDYKGIDAAIEELAAFHEAKEIIEKV